MTRAELEARLWVIGGRQMTGTVIDQILDACECYAAEQRPHTRRQAFHHVSGTDLYPLIGVLASALLRDATETRDELAAKRQKQGAA
jgi:hypothetical protein